jgi:uncharacterized integral membrane protein
MERKACAQFEERECRRREWACDWDAEAGTCSPINVSRALRNRQSQQRQAKRGWQFILLGLVLLVVAMFVVMETFFGVPVVDTFTTGNFAASPAVTVVILSVILLVGGALLRLLQICNYSFACLLIGGDAGLIEQPVTRIRQDQRRQTRLSAEHIIMGQVVAPDKVDARSDAMRRWEPLEGGGRSATRDYSE